MGGGVWVIRPPVIYKCPVCRVPVDEIDGNTICGHFDRVGEYCEGSHEPFRIAIAERARP